MAEAELINRLEEVFVCSICLLSPTDPKMLPCHHAFCAECIHDMYKRTVHNNPTIAGRLKCPMCKAVAHVPSGDLSRLLGDFRANQVASILKERLDSKAKERDPREGCYVCKKLNVSVDATVLCFDCSKTFCGACFEKHNANPRYAYHVHSSVKTGDISTLICDEHDEFVQAHCMVCEKTVCQVCMLTTHGDHDVRQIINKSSKPKSDLNESRTSLECRIELYELELYSTRNHLLQMSDYYTVVVDEQKANCELLKKEVRRHKTKLVNSLEAQEKQIYAALNQKQLLFEKDCSALTSRVLHALDRLDSVENRWTLIEKPIPEAPDVILADVDEYALQVLDEFDDVKSTDTPLKSCQIGKFVEGDATIGSIEY